jgi:hypothetical protein
MKIIPVVLTCAAAVSLLAGCGNKESAPVADTNPADVTNNVLVNSKRTADKTIETTALNQTVQLFFAQEGRFPKTLEELTPKYIAKLPEPPLGYKLSYDAVKGEVSVVRQ